MATNAAKPPKTNKPQAPAANRIIDQMKRSTLQGKLTADELDKIATLANSLKLFLTA